jgi:FtsZ-binding cell division protein ZapB
MESGGHIECEGLAMAICFGYDAQQEECANWMNNSTFIAYAANEALSIIEELQVKAAQRDHEIALLHGRLSELDSRHPEYGTVVAQQKQQIDELKAERDRLKLEVELADDSLRCSMDAHGKSQAENRELREAVKTRSRHAGQ